MNIQQAVFERLYRRAPNVESDTNQAVELFAPLRLQAYDETHFDVAFPIGRMRAGVYWFSRSLN